MSWGGIVHGITEGVEDLVIFSAVFVFGMIFVGEIYGVRTVNTLSQGIFSPFYYPLWVAVLLVVIRIIDDMSKPKSGK